MIADGHRRLEGILESIRAHRGPNPPKNKIPPTLLPAYIADMNPPQMPGIGTNIEQELYNHQDPLHGYHLVDVNSNRPGASIQSPYLNYVHKDGLAIICIYNFKKDDEVPSHEKKSWTDIMAASCVESMVESGRTADTMASLRSVWRINVQNQQTETLIAKIASKNRQPRATFEVRADEPLFFALVASDHGRGVASMLRDYPWMFGYRTIVSAKVLPNGKHPSFYWRLDVVVSDRQAQDARQVKASPALQDSPSSKKQKRMHKRMESRESNLSQDQE